MYNENVWIMSDKNSKSLVNILVGILFAKDYEFRVKNFEDIESMDELKTINFNQENQIVYYAFENVQMSEYIRNKCRKHNIIYLDIYANTYNNLASIVTKINKGLNIATLLKESKELNPVDFTMSNDDGSNPKSIVDSDIVIIGVSRTSKTPLSIYMSNHGYRVTNIPLVPEIEIPKELFDIDNDKIFALIMEPERLVDIRKERLKSLGLPMDSGYASLDRVVHEIEYSKSIIDKLNCKSIDVTHISIEEASERIKNYIDRRKEF